MIENASETGRSNQSFYSGRIANQSNQSICMWNLLSFPIMGPVGKFQAKSETFQAGSDLSLCRIRIRASNQSLLVCRISNLKTSYQVRVCIYNISNKNAILLAWVTKKKKSKTKIICKSSCAFGNHSHMFLLQIL